MKNTCKRFTVDGGQFEALRDPRTGAEVIQGVNPYDPVTDTEFHWARREACKSALRKWNVYRAGEHICTLWLQSSLLEEEAVARGLAKLDRAIHELAQAKLANLK